MGHDASCRSARQFQKPPAILSDPGTQAQPGTPWQHLTGGSACLLGAAMTGTMAAFTSMSMVNLAVPGMVSQFQLAHGDAPWVASVFLLAMATALPATPCLLRRWGVRTCYGGATLLLLLGAALCAMSTSFAAVLAGRMLQGLAAGLMQPVPLILVQRRVAAPWRARSLGVIGAGSALALAVGPWAGGLLIERFGWQGVFALPVPLGLVSLALLAASLTDTRPAEDAHPVNTARPMRLDWLSLVLAGLTVLALMQGLRQLAAGQVVLTLLALAAGTASAAGLAARQQLHHAAGTDLEAQALVPRALWCDRRRYGLSCLAALFYGLVLNAFTYLLPLWLHDSLGLTESRIGMVLLLAALATVFVQPVAASLVDLRAHWPVLGLGYAVIAAALVLLPLAGAADQQVAKDARSIALVTAAALLCRVGLACAFAALFTPAQRALPPELQAHGAMLAQLSQTVGGVLGIGLMGVALQQGWTASSTAPVPGASADAAFWWLAAVALLASALTWRLRHPPQPAPAPHPHDRT